MSKLLLTIEVGECTYTMAQRVVQQAAQVPASTTQEDGLGQNMATPDAGHGHGLMEHGWTLRERGF